MMDPGCSLPNAKWENLTGLSVKGLLKEYGIEGKHMYRFEREMEKKKRGFS